MPKLVSPFPFLSFFLEGGGGGGVGLGLVLGYFRNHEFVFFVKTAI